MIYSREILQSLSAKNKKIRINTLLISSLLLLITILCGALIFVLDSFVFVTLGFIMSMVLFGYVFYRFEKVHTKIKAEENFYADIVYAEKTTVEVEFLSLDGEIITNTRKFNQILVYNLKTECNSKYLVDPNHQLFLQQGKRYLFTLTNNILVDYKGVENEF